MKQRYWHIVGFDGNQKIYERTVKLGYFSEKQLKVTLKSLTAKAGLSYDEIVNSYAKKGTKISNSHLLVTKGDKNQSYSCGCNPHFIARVVFDCKSDNKE